MSGKACLNKHQSFRGKYFHITGSASENISIQNLEIAHEIVRELVKTILSLGGNLVITAGGESYTSLEKLVPLVFDWTIIESILENVAITGEKLDSSTPEIKLVTYSNWREKTPPNRKSIQRKLLSHKTVEFIPLKHKVSVGGKLRKTIIENTDIVISLGGQKGVHHLAELAEKKGRCFLPVPLNLGNNASMELGEEFQVNPALFFPGMDTKRINALYSQLIDFPRDEEINAYSGSIVNLLNLIDEDFSPSSRGNSWKYLLALFPFLNPNEELEQLQREIEGINERCGTRRKKPTKENCLDCENTVKDHCWMRILAKTVDGDTRPFPHHGFEVVDIQVTKGGKIYHFVLKSDSDITGQKAKTLIQQCTKLFTRRRAVIFYLNPFITPNVVIDEIFMAASNAKTNPTFVVIPRKYTRQIFAQYKELEDL